MTLKKTKFLKSYAAAIAMSLLASCGQNKVEQREVTPAKKIAHQNTLTIELFSEFPEEVKGCSCYFSIDSTAFKKNQYIYISDFDKTSFIKVNGELTKFTKSDSKEVDDKTKIVSYKSDKYNATIELKDGIKNGDETQLKTGAITVTDKKGAKVTKKFYGECGC